MKNFRNQKKKSFQTGFMKRQKHEEGITRKPNGTAIKAEKKGIRIRKNPSRAHHVKGESRGQGEKK